MAVSMESALGQIVYPRPTYPSYSRFSQPGIWPKCPPEEDYNHYNAQVYTTNGPPARGNFTINPEWLSEDISPAEFTRSKWKPWPYEYPGARAEYTHPKEHGFVLPEVKLGHRSDPNLAQPGYSPYKYVPISQRTDIKDRWAWNGSHTLLDPRPPSAPPSYNDVMRLRNVKEGFGLQGQRTTNQDAYPDFPGTSLNPRNDLHYRNAYNRDPVTGEPLPTQAYIFSQYPKNSIYNSVKNGVIGPIGSLNIKINPMEMRDPVKAGLSTPKSASFSVIPPNFSSAEKNPRENPGVRTYAEPQVVKLPYPVASGTTPYLTTQYPSTFMAEYDNCKVRYMGNKYIRGYMTRCDWGP